MSDRLFMPLLLLLFAAILVFGGDHIFVIFGCWTALVGVVEFISSTIESAAMQRLSRPIGSHRPTPQPGPVLVAASAAAVPVVAREVTPPIASKPIRRKPNRGGPRFFPGSRDSLPGRIHLDECVSERLIASMLRADGYSVTTAFDSDLCRALDEEHLRFSFERRALLVSFDRDFEALDRSGLPHCGILRAEQGQPPSHVVDLCKQIMPLRKAQA